MTVKLLQQGDTHVVIGGYGVVWGGADMVGDRFEPTTDFRLDLVPRKPVFYDHTLGDAPQVELGEVVRVQSDEKGLWVEAQLERHRQYVEQVLKLVEQGALGWSSGSVAHLVRRDGSGAVRSWPIVEFSLTPTPCEPRCLGVERLKSILGDDMRLGFFQRDDAVSGAVGDTEVVQQGDAGGTDSALLARLDQLERQLKAFQSQPERKAGYVVPTVEGEVLTRSQAEEEQWVKRYNAYIRTGVRHPSMQAVVVSGVEPSDEVKAGLEEASGTTGGYLVPITYSDQMIAALKDMSILRAAGARVLRVSGSNSFKVPTTTNTAAAVLTSENNAFDEAQLIFAEVGFTPWKYTRLAKASDELLLDSRFDIMGQILIPDFAQAFAAAENTAFTLGTGTGQPQGIVAGASNLTDTATSGTFAADDVITLYHKLPYLYRQRAAWFMNDLTAKVVRTFKESTTGNYLWQPGLQAGQPDRLLGRPVYTLNAMAGLTGATSQTAGTKFLCFCDPMYFWIIDFGGESIKRLDELYASMGQVGFRAYRRVDSRIMLQEAIQVMKVKA